MTVSILRGDCREVLRSLPSESVHCVVTSPPYWGLRDYGTARWEGGDGDCDHIERTAAACHISSTLGPNKDGLKPNNAAFRALERQFSEKCSKCGARRIDNQMGMERSLGDHVDGMAEVFREVRRVLRSDGTLWLNYGDSYAANMNGRSAADIKALGIDDRTFRDKPFSTVGPILKDNIDISRSRPGATGNQGNIASANGYRISAGGYLKPKDLCGIPWRVAFALQADGWWLRQDIIWSKPNPMPESVTDRCTKAHEYLFLLSKNERYYFDQEAIKIKSNRAGEICGTGPKSLSRGSAKGASVNPSGNAVDGGFVVSPEMANKRSVWEIATAPFAEAHFATFPPALIEPCILAGCPKGGAVLDPFGGAGTTGLVADKARPRCHPDRTQSRICSNG